MGYAKLKKIKGVYCKVYPGYKKVDFFDLLGQAQKRMTTKDLLFRRRELYTEKLERALEMVFIEREIYYIEVSRVLGPNMSPSKRPKMLGRRKSENPPVNPDVILTIAAPGLHTFANEILCKLLYSGTILKSKLRTFTHSSHQTPKTKTFVKSTRLGRFVNSCLYTIGYRETLE